jgi:hypothetical protein
MRVDCENIRKIFFDQLLSEMLATFGEFLREKFPKIFQT